MYLKSKLFQFISMYNIQSACISPPESVLLSKFNKGMQTLRKLKYKWQSVFVLLWNSLKLPDLNIQAEKAVSGLNKT